jgi:hypothetical protein
MDNLPIWAVWIAAVAVGLAPGLAMLCAPMIARLIHRVASPGSDARAPTRATLLSKSHRSRACSSVIVMFAPNTEVLPELRRNSTVRGLR